MTTREEFEAALDGHNLWIAMRNGRYWKARRNGRTQTWKTRPHEFSIPFKVGLKECGRITADWTEDLFRIGDE